MPHFTILLFYMALVTTVFITQFPVRQTTLGGTRLVPASVFCDTNMRSLRLIRRFRFAKPHTRNIQSSAVIFRAIQSPSPSVDNTFGEEPLRFNDGTRIFASKRTSEILRSLFVLNLCSYDIVARNSMAVREEFLISNGLKF